LFPTPTQNLIGDVQEVLIYSSVSPVQDAAVQQYIAKKYFYPSLILPQLVSAARNATNNTSVLVTFSSVVTAATATNATNYSIGGGVTVSSATMSSASTVTLTTSPINSTQVLTVNGVADWAGNSVALNAHVNISVPNPDLHLTISRQAGQTTIIWGDPSALLQSAAAVLGPWSDIVGATSPYSVTNSANMMFYRLH
jgi:hypothetical protein